MMIKKITGKTTCKCIWLDKLKILSFKEYLLPLDFRGWFQIWLRKNFKEVSFKLLKDCNNCEFLFSTCKRCLVVRLLFSFDMIFMFCSNLFSFLSCDAYFLPRVVVNSEMLHVNKEKLMYLSAQKINKNYYFLNLLSGVFDGPGSKQPEVPASNCSAILSVYKKRK